MKKIMFFILLLICAVIMTACTNTDSMQPNEIGNNAIAVGNEELVEKEELPIAVTENDVVYVADAAMYRGTVTNIEETEFRSTDTLELKPTKIITLTQADGTNFGAQTMTFLVNSMTTGYTDILEGNYLEVFYGRPMQGEFDYTAMQDAIGINNLGTAQMVNFNGTILSIQKNGTRITSLTMLDMTTSQKVIFNVSNDTNMYLTASDLKQGDTLNIYHRGE